MELKMMGSTADLLARIHQGEDVTFEMKRFEPGGYGDRSRALTTLANPICAMANTAGGAVVVGVDEVGRVVQGVPLEAVDKLKASIGYATWALIQPPVTVEVQAVELPDPSGLPRLVVWVEVPRSPQVHRSRNKHLVRIGSRNVEASPEQVAPPKADALSVHEPTEAAASPTPSAPSLRVVWLEVEGFRRLQERSFLDFRNPRGEAVAQMIIAGINGGGKTTLLEALLLGLGREDLILRDVPKGERSPGWRGRLPQGARISLCIEHNGILLRSDRDSKLHRWCVVEEPFGTPTRLVGDRSGLGSLPVEYFSSWRAPALVGPVWPTTAGKKSVDNEVNRLRMVKQKLLDRRTLRSYSAGDRTDPWLERINEAWKTFHGQDGTSLADQPVAADDEAAGFDLFVMEADGRRRCSIDQASAGEIELVCMAGVLTVTDFPGLLLIDEPELHLHPEWQARIVPALQKLAPKAQIIATSHAPAPWDRAYDYQRYFLAPTGDPRRSDLTPPPERT
jgi:energy-coupling factor transporter ATP-binding protein EcfA2